MGAQLMFILFTVLGAIAFGIWMDSVLAACFMFFALYLLAP